MAVLDSELDRFIWEPGDVLVLVAARAMRRLRRVTARSQTVANPRIGHRERLSHEVAAAADFEAIQAAWQAATETLVTEWQTVLAAQIDSLVEQIRTAVATGNTAALVELAAPVMGADLIGDRMMSAAEEAVSAARAEAAAQGVTISLVDVAELEPRIRSRAEASARLLARSISDTAARQALNRYGASGDADEVAAAVRTHLDELSDAYLNDELGGALTQAQNTGRRAVMGQRTATYYASELLDQNTCERCQAVDGRQYRTISDAERDYPTGGHSECMGGPRCRGTLVAVYDESEATTP